LGTRSAFVSREPVRLWRDEEAKAGDWVEIKAKLGQGDRLRLVDDLLEMKALAGNSQMVSIAKYGAFVAALMRLSVIGWSLTDGAGAAVPFAPETIDDLDPDDPLVERVQAEVVSRNPLGLKRTTGDTP
jgi:hypothetical protein